MAENQNALLWDISKYSQNEPKYESAPIEFNNTNFIVSIHPRSAEQFLVFTINQKSNLPSEANSSHKNLKSAIIYIRFSCENLSRSFKKGIYVGVPEQSLTTTVLLKKFNEQYNGKPIKITISISQSSSNQHSSSKQQPNNDSKLSPNHSTVKNTLSTVSSPVRQQSVSKNGRFSKASTSSTSSTAAQAPASHASKNSISSAKNNPKVIAPNVAKGSSKQPKSNLPTHKKTPILTTDQYPSNSGRKKPTGIEPMKDPPTVSNKPVNASPKAAISASKASPNSNAPSEGRPL